MERTESNYKSVLSDSRFIEMNATRADNRSIFNKLADDGCESFYNYIAQQGVSREEDVIILSSVHHYFYSEDEFNGVKAVVNLKQLNKEKELDVLVDTISRMAPSSSCFVGCFVNNNKYTDKRSGRAKHTITDKEEYENGIKSKNPFLNKVINLIDSKTNRYLSPDKVETLLGNYGFVLTDTTEINGITYFCSRKVSVAAA